MQIKIGDKVYKDDEQPIGVFLTAQDRINIIAMEPNKNFYCSYPKDTPGEDVQKFMTMPRPVAPVQPLEK